MENISVVGAQWGDEGKGKVVDLLAAKVDVVVRYSGGANAGHTLVVDDRKYVVHLLPSGIVHPDKMCVLGSSVVLDPTSLLEEIDDLKRAGISVSEQRLKISARAHLVLPVHRALDAQRELGARALGTTKRGIGPTYEDRAGRRGVRVSTLLRPERLAVELEPLWQRANAEIVRLGGAALPLEPALEQLKAQAAKLAPYIADVSAVVADARKAGKRLLFEGAQGALLDLDQGSYPFVTSSTTLPAGACASIGVSPRALGTIVGVTKAYTTRVGEGPFPSELDGELGESLRKAGGEFGATTGRPRRCGWLDLPALAHAVRVAGIEKLAVTKLDVLAQVQNPELCIGYLLDGERIDGFVADPDVLSRIEPVCEPLPGWPLKDPFAVRASRQISDLPAPVRALLDRIASAVNVEVGLVSVGPERSHTIVVDKAL
jgi:adenylosuccinate synthase